MSRILAESGVQGTLITFCGFSDDDTDIPINHYSVISSIGFWAKPLRLLLKFLNFVPPCRPLIYPLQTTLTFWLALRQGKKQEYDVVHLLNTSTVSFLFLAFAYIVKHRNLILTFHGLPREHLLKNWRKDFTKSLKAGDYYICFCILISKLSSSGLISSVKKFLYHHAIKKNHLAFVCHAQEEREAYAQCVFYDRVTYVPESRPKPALVSMQEARQHLKLPQDRWIFLCFGINSNNKNYEVIFQAVQDLPRNFQLLFTGKVLTENAKSNDPNQLTEEYRLVGNTTVVNRFITEGEKRYYFYAADALILSYYKGFSQQSGNLLDACQYGLPVIATGDEQIGEWVRSYNIGLTFIPEDSSSLRQAISAFMNLSDKERQGMGNHMSEFGASVRSWEQMSRGYLDLYQSLLEKNYV
jgi:glycosyltransferase involved in cell wall biosynthesis